MNFLLAALTVLRVAFVRFSSPEFQVSVLVTLFSSSVYLPVCLLVSFKFFISSPKPVQNIPV